MSRLESNIWKIRSNLSAAFALMLIGLFPTHQLARAATSGNGNPDTRPLIWNGLRLGMTRVEVEAILPKRLVPLGNGCNIVAYAKYEDKRLFRVDMEWSVKDVPSKRCGVIVQQALVEKYGEPDQEDREIETIDCGNSYASGVAGALAGLCEAAGGDEPTSYRLLRWNRDGVEITFKIDTGADDPRWWAVYRASPKLDPGISDKF